MDGELTNKFLEKSNVVCKPTTNALSTCFIGDIYVQNCDAHITCETTVNTKTVSCDREKTYELISQTADDLLKNNAAAANRALKVLSDAGVDTSKGLQQSLQAFVTVKCDPYVVGQQSIFLPKIVLKDCSNVTITAINQLDQTAKCSLGKVGEILQVAGVGQRTIPDFKPPQPDTTMIIVLSAAAALLLILSITLGVVLRNKRIKDYAADHPKPKPIRPMYYF